MAKRKWSHLKKYQFKKGKKRRARRASSSKKRKRKVSNMARKRKHRRRSSGGRRRYHGRRRSSRRRHHAGGAGGRGVAAIKQDATLMVVAGLYGLAESKAKSDATFILNKLPKPVAQLGFAGNTALALYLATMLTPNKYVRLAARGVAMVAAYQLGKNGGAFSSGTQILGEVDGDDERIIDAHVMGALEAEGGGTGRQQGLTYDTVVREAGGRV